MGATTLSVQIVREGLPHVLLATQVIPLRLRVEIGVRQAGNHGLMCQQFPEL
jgi:hypothetical protein